VLDLWILNVGHGDSIVLRCEKPEGAVFGVVDSNRTGTQTPAALDKLRQLGATKLSFVMLTHPHADHYQGLSEILKAYDGRIDHFYTFPVGDFITAKAKKLKDLFARMIKETEGSQREALFELFTIFAHAKRCVRERTLVWEEPVGRWNRVYPPGFDALRLEVLLPLPKCKGVFFQLLDAEDPRALVTDTPNTLSTVLRISLNQTVLMLGADSPYNAWYDHRAQTQKYGDRPDAHLVKVPHHGSKHDVRPDAIQYWFSPADDDGTRRFGLVSADGRRHPHVEALRALQSASVHPYCTNLARPCGGSRIDAMFTSSDVPLEVRRIINSGDVELPAGVSQPCQGEIHVNLDPGGRMTVTPQFNHPCGYRGDYQKLGLT